MQKLQLRAAAASGSTTFHVDHATIRTDLERLRAESTQRGAYARSPRSNVLTRRACAGTRICAEPALRRAYARSPH